MARPRDHYAALRGLFVESPHTHALDALLAGLTMQHAERGGGLASAFMYSGMKTYSGALPAAGPARRRVLRHFVMQQCSGKMNPHSHDFNKQGTGACKGSCLHSAWRDFQDRIDITLADDAADFALDGRDVFVITLDELIAMLPAGLRGTPSAADKYKSSRIVDCKQDIRHTRCGAGAGPYAFWLNQLAVCGSGLGATVFAGTPPQYVFYTLKIPPCPHDYGACCLGDTYGRGTVQHPHEAQSAREREGFQPPSCASGHMRCRDSCGNFYADPSTCTCSAPWRSVPVAPAQCDADELVS